MQLFVRWLAELNGPLLTVPDEVDKFDLWEFAFFYIPMLLCALVVLGLWVYLLYILRRIMVFQQRKQVTTPPSIKNYQRV